MVTAALADLAVVESTLAQRGELATRNNALIANLTTASCMLRQGAAVMTGEQWSAAGD